MMGRVGEFGWIFKKANLYLKIGTEHTQFCLGNVYERMECWILIGRVIFAKFNKWE